MEQKNIVAAAIILALIIVGMFTFAYLSKTDTPRQVETPGDNNAIDEQPNPGFGGISSIEATHYIVDGLHTIAGEIDMPTPCELLEWDVRIMESFPEQVVIDFTVRSESDLCIQVITPQRFKTAVEVSENATFSATLQGAPIELILTPAAEGEHPDDFELFIKG